MKKITILAIALLASCIGVYAQNFKPSGNSIDQLFNGDAKNTSTVEGDINKDGKKDICLIVSDDMTTHQAIYFGNAKGGYDLYRDISSDLPNDAKITINDKGVIRIQIDLESGSDIFLFRYQDNCLRLIGGKEDRHKSNDYDVSYNYLTSKMIKTTGSGKDKTSETKDMDNLPILRMGWFPLKYDMLHYLVNQTYYNERKPTPEWKEALGIFRLMQSGYFLFGFFNDYENEYHDILPAGDNKFEAEFMTERPMVYNHYSTLTMEKLSDGTYKIHIEDAHRDRNYESIVEQYISDHPEDEDLDYDELMEKSGAEYPSEEYEQEESTYIFKDGEFIEQK